MKKGFTLVELLATIVILAIILVIAVPQILNTIESARLSSLKDSALLIATSAEKEYLSLHVLNENYNELSIPCSNVIKLNDEYDSCKINYSSNSAIVMLKGKSGGKFSGMICSGTKENMKCTKSDDMSTNSSCFTVSNLYTNIGLKSYTVNKSECVSMYSGSLGASATNYCNGENIIYNGKTKNMDTGLKSNINLVQQFEHYNVLSNVKYGTPKSYTINYNGCTTYYSENTEMNNSDIESLCKGNKVSIDDNLVDMYQLVEEGGVTLYDGKGVISVIYDEAEPNKVINDYSNSCSKDVEIPNTINDGIVTKINSNAFKNKSLTSVKIHSLLEEIGANAFSNNNLSKVDLENANIIIGNCAFDDINNIETHNIPNTYSCS